MHCLINSIPSVIHLGSVAVTVFPESIEEFDKLEIN